MKPTFYMQQSNISLRIFVRALSSIFRYIFHISCILRADILSVECLSLSLLLSETRYYVLERKRSHVTPGKLSLSRGRIELTAFFDLLSTSPSFSSSVQLATEILYRTQRSRRLLIRRSLYFRAPLNRARVDS